MTEKLPSLLFLRQAVRALLPFALSCLPACIDVGHPAEVGCLVDPTEPGCTPEAPDESDEDTKATSSDADAAKAGTNDASSADAGASAAAR